MHNRQSMAGITAFTICLLLTVVAMVSPLHAANYQLIINEQQINQLQTLAADQLASLPPADRCSAVQLTPAIAKPDILVAGDTLELNLFPDTVYTAQVDKVTSNVNGTVTVRGRIKNNPYAYAIITTTGNRSLVKIEVPEKNQKFVIQSDTSGNHYLLDQSNVALDELEGGPSPIPPADTGMPDMSNDNVPLGDPLDPATIDIMIVYTPSARSLADSSLGGIENIVAQGIATGQLTCDNSNTVLTLRLVHSAEITYTENGDSGIDIERLTGTTDGYMDDVHTWRNTYGADIVSLITNVTDVGGLGWVLNTTAGLPNYAFNLCRVQQASGYSLVHEQGHNMGCRHHKDQNVQPGPGIFSYSAGGRWTGTDGGHYCSVMTYEGGSYFTDGITHSRVAHWSNPNINHQGVPTGDAEDADNARSIREIKHVIAAYRDDVTLPTISIGAPSVTTTKSGPVTYTITYGYASSISLAAGDVTLTKTGTANGTVTVSGTGTTTRTVRIDSITGDGTIKISIDAGTASNSDGDAPAAGPSAAFTVDNTAPTIIIGSPSENPTNNGPITYNVVYTGASNITLSTANITLTKTGTANGTVGVSGSGTSLRVVTISSITGDGTLRISIAAGTASDSAGNTAPAAGPSVTLTVDNISPTINISAPNHSSVNTGPVDYTITYGGADDITLAVTNITLNKTGTANGTVSVSGSGDTTRTVTISGITGYGTLGVSIASATASDDAGNTVASAGPSATFNVDNTSPTVSITQAKGQADPTNESPVYFVAVFSETVTDFATGDVTITGTADGTKTAIVSGSGTNYIITVSGMTSSGTVIASLAAGVAHDESGNDNTASTGTNNIVTYDITAPSISISAPSVSVTNDGPVTYTITYRDADNVTLTVDDITLNKTSTANGTIAVSGSGTATRTVTISNTTGDGRLGITIAAGTASDDAGNTALGAGPSTTFTVDNRRPTLSISTPSATTTSTGPVSYTISYSGAGSITLTSGNVTLNKTGTADGTVAVTGSGTTTRTVTITNITGEGTLGISIAAGTASDAAGNTALAAGPSSTFTVAPITGYTLSATVTLGDYNALPDGVPVTIDLIAATGEILRTDNITLDSAGKFYIHDVAPGTYNVGIKPSHWLRKVTDPVTIIDADVDFVI